MLIQEDENKKKHLIACGSSKLTQAQRGYSTTELELCAAVYAVKKCRYWLKGARDVVLGTDNCPLEGMSKKPLSDFDNERLMRLFESISTYSLEWEYINAKMNNIADTLSRLPVDENEEEEGINEGVFIGNNGEEIVPNNVQEMANK